MNQTIAPEIIKSALSEEQLAPIRRGEYTAKDWATETGQKFKGPSPEFSENWGTYAMLNRATRSKEAREILGRAWAEALKDYEGPRTFGPVSIEEAPDDLEITDLEILDRIIGQPLPEQVGFLQSKLPDIAENRARLGKVAEALEIIALDRYPNLREECEELVGLRRAIGDPEPEAYAYDRVMAVLLQHNRAPSSEAFDLEYLEAIRECYTWSKEAQRRLEHLAELEGGPYRPLVDWLKDLSPKESTALGYTATLLDVEELANRIIEEEGLAKATPETIERLESKWRPIALATYNRERDERALDPNRPELPLPYNKPLEYRTLASDKGSEALAHLVKVVNTTLEDFGLETFEKPVNLAPKNDPEHAIILEYTLYAPEGERMGLTAMEKAVLDYISTRLRIGGRIEGDKYERYVETENNFIRGVMSLPDDANVKTHQKTIRGILKRLSQSRGAIGVPITTPQNNKFVKAIEEVLREEGLQKEEPRTAQADSIRFAIERNALVFTTYTISYQDYEVCLYSFETMPFFQYIADRFGQTVRIPDSLYRTPRLTAEELTPSARQRAEELKLLSKGRKGEETVLSLENNMENVGLKNWVCSTIEKKHRKYGPMVKIDYEELYAQVKGDYLDSPGGPSITTISDREKRTMRTNLRKFLVYLMNNPDSDVIDFEEHTAPKSRRITYVTIRLRDSLQSLETRE